MNRRQRKDLAHIVTLIVNAEQGGVPLGMAFLQYVGEVRKESRDAALELSARGARETAKLHEGQAREEDDKWHKLSSHMHHDIANQHHAAATALTAFADACEALTKTPLDDSNI